MLEQKKFRIIQAGKFLKKDTIPPSGNSYGSRRMVLKKMSLLAFGINPLVRSIDKALSMPFTVRKAGKAICFLAGGKIAWEIDPVRFGDHTILKFNEFRDGFDISLHDAEYPSTGIRADFSAKVSRETGEWRMNIRAPWLGIDEDISFIRWLSGNAELKGQVISDIKVHAGENDSVVFPAPSAVNLDRYWNISISPADHIILDLCGGKEYFTSAGISLKEHNLPGWIDTGYFKRASHIALRGAQSCFRSLGDLKYGSGQAFLTESWPFGRTGLISGRSEKGPACLLWACNDYGMDYQPVQLSLPHAGGSMLAFTNSRFVKEYTGSSEPFSFIADLDSTPQWVGLAGSSFALAATADPSFVLNGEGSAVTEMDLKARLVGSRIRIGGASSLPVDYSPGPEIHLIPQEIKGMKMQPVTPGQVVNPMNIKRIDDQDTQTNWLYLDREATRVRFRTDRSILINLIRPNDFLNLQFEFVNFTIDNNLLRTDDPKSPSFMIVWFPSQHTREEMFRASEKPRVPVRFLRAGSSRLVFRVPSGYQPIPLILDSLLKWDDFEIQVNYRARWFNTGRSAEGLLKERLRRVSMVFTPAAARKDDLIKSPPLNLKSREVRVIDPEPVKKKPVNQPLTAQEIKIAVSTTPKGSGRMSLSEDNLGNILAGPAIELTQIDKIKGSMLNLFQMGAPSRYETSIEAPAWLEVSPNQLAGFAHNRDLRDEFGEYDETQVERLDISDEPVIVPEKKPAQAMTERQVAARQVQQVQQAQQAQQIQQVQQVQQKPVPEKQQITTIRKAEPVITQKGRYKTVVSPASLKIAPALLIQQGQLFELWHTRMGVRLASGEIDEDALGDLKTIRALWSPCAGEKASGPARTMSVAGKYFYSLPEPLALHQLVHLTSNYTELSVEKSNVKADPFPVKAKRLMLSGLGAWLDYEFRDERDIAGFSLQAWLQRATMGRDHYIKLVRRGYLFPFGHKAVRITVGERRIQMVDNVYTAVIIVKEFIVIKQPELFYDHPSGAQGFIPFPFRRVEIKDLEKQVDLRDVSSGTVFELYEVTDTSRPVYFRIEMDDAAGQLIRTEVPLVFIDASVKDQSVAVKNYSSSGWDYFSSMPASKPVAYARSLVPGDTSFETRSIMFGARSIAYDIEGVRFFPEIIESSVFVKQMEELTGERKEIRIQLVDDNNLSMVFAKVHPKEKAELIFGDTETSGGFLTPNMAITGFSKLTGLTGNDLSNLDNLIVVAEKIFSLVEKIPKIFGILNFADLLLPSVNLTDAVKAIRSQVEKIRDQIEDHLQDILSMMARADSELKRMERFISAISSITDDKGILSALQDPGSIAQALGAQGIAVSQGTLQEAVNSAISAGREIALNNITLTTLTGYINNAAGLRNELANAGVNIPQQTVASMLRLAEALVNNGFEDAEIVAIVNALGLASGVASLQGVVKTLAEEISTRVFEAIPEIPNVKFQVRGNEIVVEYRWKPKTKNKYELSIFTIKNLKDDSSPIEVSVDSIMKKSIDLKSPPLFDVNASINKFTIIIASTLQLNFERLSFKSGSGSKSNVDLKFMPVPIRLTGSLSFVNSLQKVISADQFSAGPFIDVTSSGIEAGYNFPLPNIEVGILALSNMMLGTKLRIPFNSEPLTIGFNFSSRENPFKVLVSCFGGGGFFSLETTMRGLTRLDAAFEFGAGISLDVGVASGSVEAMGGIYYCLIAGADGNSYSLTAYLRITGRLSILKLIKITLEFYLEMRYESVGKKDILEDGKQVLTVDRSSRLVGTASLSVKVEVLFFSKTVKVTVKRTFAGNDADPKFADAYSLEHWQGYCAAFAS